jgi:hypothetical protein
MTAFGVSPAFVFSRHTTNYTSADCCDAVCLARDLGFGAFQPEVYHTERLNEWFKGGASRVCSVARDQQVDASQFVAHFLMHGFASRSRLGDLSDVDALKKVAEMAAAFPGCRVLTVPLARYQPELPADVGPAAYAEAWALLVRKVACYLDVARGAGLKLALELLPYS